MAPLDIICAGWSPDDTACQKDGRFTCKNCKLVVYCGPTCQKSHWTSHKTDCKSHLGKETWQPNWVLESRKPAFVGDDSLMSSFGGKTYVWGNMPAFDVLKLGSNEGVDYKGPLNLLFAASGDLRNFVKTMAQLPVGYNGAIAATLNDRELDVVSRNAIMLLIALVVDNIDEAVDCIMHVWYSALIRKSHLEILQQRVRPLVKEICDKTKTKDPTSVLGKTWQFGRHTLRLVLAKSAWDALLSYLNVPPGLNVEDASRIRRAVTLAEARRDYRDRHLLFHSQFHRVAKRRYWKDGILLPFGSPRGDFVEPNPTLFQAADAWPLSDNADPLNGWLLKDVDATSSGPATNDIYGKLFYHVRGVLGSFLRRLSAVKATLRVLHVNALELHDYVELDSFDRIEVSNISDRGYIGPHRTVALMTPLLRAPSTNPNATLIMLFMNIIYETMTPADEAASMAKGSKSAKQLVQYMQPPTASTSGDDGAGSFMIKLIVARDLVTSYDRYFDRVVVELEFAKLATLVGAAMKDRHTVIEKWPFRLKLKPGQPGAQEEFDRALCGGSTSRERYVEWKRIE